MKKPKLGLVDINPFEDDGKWYFELTYNVENEDGDVVQAVFPSVRSPFTEKGPTTFHYNHPPRFLSECGSRYALSLTGSEVALCDFVSGAFSYHKIIWKKPSEEMTLKEVEKALGHPVKIVSEK